MGLAFGKCGPTLADMKNKPLPKQRNPFVSTMITRHSARFDHRNEARGGASNEQAELMAQYQEDSMDEELHELFD